MMNGHTFNKTQYVFFAKQMRANTGQVKANKSCEWLVNTHRLGRIFDKIWFYSEQERLKLIQLVHDQHQVNLLIDEYPAKQNRLVNAKTQNNEKYNALAVSHDFVLVNAFQQLKLNQQCIDLQGIASLGLSINTTQISSIEHRTLVFVENLAVMANLKKITLAEDALHLKEALWIYRGDKKHTQTTAQAYTFYKRFADTHQLVCFADFDPAGLQIALTCGATKLLAPCLSSVVSLPVSGAEKAYYDQHQAKIYLDNNPNLSTPCQQLYCEMKSNKKTLQQEHLLAHQIPLSIYKIS